MAAYLNHSISLMSGDGPNVNQLNGSGDARFNMRESSPLQIFVKAKKKINDIFVDIEGYIKDTVTFTKALEKRGGIIDTKEAEKVYGYVDKVRAIRDVLTRDHMKVAFFGRTSNGKSTVINAMLREKILPSGIGHTTNCFLQVEGTEGGDSYLMIEGSTEKQNVKSVGQMGHALCKDKLNESTLVRIFWPKEKCQLLRDDVVLVDSPGIDVTPNLDEWIDKHCLDADVFVLVANAESTLMVTEKAFFHKVSTRLSKPNIFILNNRWDASASEPDFLEQVRKQHLERAVDFLVNELKVCSMKEAQERIFFISAKEVLQGRAQEQKGLSAHTGALAEGFQVRYFEFQNFERKFEECISKSAVKTKFDQHSQRGKHIASEIEAIMRAVYEEANKQRQEKNRFLCAMQDKLKFTNQQLDSLTQEMKDKIHDMVDDVEQRISKALSEEIRRLSTLVDEFCEPFHSDPLVLNVYKKQLHSHVEKGLGSNLRARLSTALAMNIEASQREMTDKMSSLLPTEKKELSLSLFQRREPFEILYRLNCDNLCADFKENLEFRFSWGITALISRLLGRSGHNVAVSNYNTTSIPPDFLLHVPAEELSQNFGAGLSQDLSQRPQIPPRMSPGDPGEYPSGAYNSSESFLRIEDWSLPSRMALASIGSQGTMGGLLIAGFMLKTVGWRVILVTGAIYGSVYLYERLTWTNKAKERSFKRQYVDHATRKLRLIVDLTSANCSHQVQQELSRTFARLCHLVDESSKEMTIEMEKLDHEIRSLEEAGSQAKKLRNSANYVTKELEMFDDAYLRSID